MPVKSCELDTKPGFKWGDSGKCYTYTPKNEGSLRNARKKAAIQGLAIGDIKLEGDNDLLPKDHPKSDKA